MDFVAQKKGGMAVSAVWTLVYLLAPCPLEPRRMPMHTGGTPVPICKNPKASGFWYERERTSQKCSLGWATAA